MKPESILIFILCWLNYHSIVNSKTCEDSTYQPGDEDTIVKKFQSEWGILGYLNRAFYGSKEGFSHLTNEERKMLCACAFIKTDPKYANDRADLYNRVTTWGLNTFYIPITYMCFPYEQPVPSLECTYGSNKIALGKSFQKKSFSSLVWDIYVASMENGEVNSLIGIIKNVDLSFKSEKKNAETNKAQVPKEQEPSKD